MANMGYVNTWIDAQSVNKSTLRTYLRDEVVHRRASAAAIAADNTNDTKSIDLFGLSYQHDTDSSTSSNGSTILVSGDGDRYVLTSFPTFPIIDRDLATPPGSPTLGAQYIVAASPTGAWSGTATQIATWRNGAWAFIVPREGMLAWIADEDKLAYFDGSAWQLLTTGSSGTRELLTANRTYYVRTDGSNSNNGLANTSGGAWLTLQKAYDTITSTLDLGGFTVTVQIGDGTYTGGLSCTQPWTGGGAVTFQGNSTTPANVLISTTSACVDVNCSLPGTLLIKDMKLTSSASSCIFHRGTGRLQHQNNDYGTAAAYHLRGSSPGASIVSLNSYSVTAGAISHWYAEAGAKVEQGGGTVTFSGTPAFSVATAQALRLGFIFLDTVTMSGSATGTRYSAISNSVIDTRGSGATHIPGNSSGTTATGGQYI